MRAIVTVAFLWLLLLVGQAEAKKAKDGTKYRPIAEIRFWFSRLARIASSRSAILRLVSPQENRKHATYGMMTRCWQVATSRCADH